MSKDDETNSTTYQSLLRQVFELSYYGYMNAEFVENLPTEDRLYLIGLLKKAKDDEAEMYRKSNTQTRASTSSMPRMPSMNSRIKF